MDNKGTDNVKDLKISCLIDPFRAEASDYITITSVRVV